MKFSTNEIEDCRLVSIDKLEDSRGFFARTWCNQEFRDAGLPDSVVQSSISYNKKSGTVRGMHLQIPPSAEGKLVRCIRGAIFDVAIDLRSERPTFLKRITAILNDGNRDALYIPPGCAHGFQTLEDCTEVLYLMTDTYDPSLSRGFRWNDQAFGINWPLDNPTINERDASLPDFDASLCHEWHWQ